MAEQDKKVALLKTQPFSHKVSENFARIHVLLPTYLKITYKLTCMS